MKVSEILRKARRLFKRGSGVIQGVEDQSKVSEYSFTLEAKEGQEIAAIEIKNLITQNPWTSAAKPPEVLILEELQSTKKVEVRFGVISVTKAKALEDEIRSIVSAGRKLEDI